METYVNIQPRDIRLDQVIDSSNDYELLEGRILHKPGERVVVKRYSMDDLHEPSHDIPIILAEIKKLCDLPPIPRIVPYLGVYVDDRHICIVREYVEGETFTNIIPNSTFSIEEVRYICLELALALQQLHACDVYHYNLKPSNIIRTPDGQIHLVDYALIPIQELRYRNVVEPPRAKKAFMPPEVFAQGHFCKEASDVYGIGLVLWMLSAKKIPNVRRFPPAEVSDLGLRSICRVVNISDPPKRPTFALLVDYLEGKQTPPGSASTVHSTPTPIDQQPEG